MNASRSSQVPPVTMTSLAFARNVEQVVDRARPCPTEVSPLMSLPRREDVLEGQPALAVVEERDRRVHASEQPARVRGREVDAMAGRVVRESHRRVVGVAGHRVVAELRGRGARRPVVDRRRVVVEIRGARVDAVAEGPLHLEVHRPGGALRAVRQQIGSAGGRVHARERRAGRRRPRSRSAAG